MTEAERTFRPHADTIPVAGEFEVARICYPAAAAAGVVSVWASRLGSRIVHRVVSASEGNCFRRGPARLPLTTILETCARLGGSRRIPVFAAYRSDAGVGERREHLDFRHTACGCFLLRFSA